MGRRPIPPDQVLENAMRVAMLLHLVGAGGRDNAVNTFSAIGIVERGSGTFGAKVLARSGLIMKKTVGLGSKRASVLTITDTGRAALAAAELTAAEEEEQFVCAHCGRRSRRHQVLEVAA